jgi:hypothetical protein
LEGPRKLASCAAQCAAPSLRARTTSALTGAKCRKRRSEVNVEELFGAAAEAGVLSRPVPQRTFKRQAWPLPGTDESTRQDRPVTERFLQVDVGWQADLNDVFRGEM